MSRKEHDLLGEREVPDNVYWGVHTLRAVENFQISRSKISDVPELIKAYAWVKKATALANSDLGKLSADKKDVIVKACDLLLEGKFADQFPVDVFQGGAGTSVNMNANEVIANIALELMGMPKGRYDVIHPNDDVNMSQSTNDSYPTAVRLAFVIAAHDLIENHIEPLQHAFHLKAQEFARILKMGRTQLQDAVPMTVGQEFEAFADLMEEEVKSVNRTTELLLEINLGATAIGTGVNTPEGFTAQVTKRLAEVSGLNVVTSKNLIEATSDCGAYVSVHGSLKRIAVKLGKICNDLRLLSSGPRAGLHEYNLPERAAGSSIMPAKVNPIIPEVVNQVAFKVMGNDVVVTMAAEAGQLQLNAMEPVIGQSMFESISLLGHAADCLRANCVNGITINEKVCHDYVQTSIGLVTYLNTVLGHAACDEIGKECAAEGKTVREVVLERGLLSEDQVDKILGFDNLVAL